MIKGACCRQCKKDYMYDDTQCFGMYCSLSCFHNSRRKVTTCQRCHKSFVQQRSKKHQYCSRECMNTHKNSNDDELQINFTPDLDQEPDIPLVIKDEGWLKKMKQWWRKFFN